MAVRRSQVARPLGFGSFLCGILLAMSMVETKALVPFPPPKQQSMSPDRILSTPIRPITRKLLNDPGARKSALHMGIRSILGGIRKNRDDDDTSKPVSSAVKRVPSSAPVEPEKSVKPKTNTATDANAKTEEPVPSPPVRMGQNPNTKEVNVNALDRKESVQERINRVKSGKMTAEEKEAFLETALSAGLMADSRNPLRMSVPEQELTKKRGRASPFPTDSILRNFARGKNASESPMRDEMLESAVFDSQKKKRQYLDMVTNPDRFAHYKSAPKGTRTGVAPISGAAEGSERKTLIPDNSSLDLLDIIKPKVLDPEPSGVDPMPVDLGARLEAAASANEKIRTIQEAERQKLSAQVEERRQESKMQMEELAKQRQNDLARREREVMEQRRNEEERLARDMQERKQAEQKRLGELMKAQEEYWNKKLANERRSKVKTVDQTEKEDSTKDEKEMLKEEAEEPVDVAAEVTETKPYGGPDESNLLELAEHDKEESWEHNQETIERKASEITGKAPVLNHIQSEKGFLEERSERKAQIDGARAEQLRRLKELNSPLPSPRSQIPPSMSPAFESQRSGLAPPSPSLLRPLNDRVTVSAQEKAEPLSDTVGRASFSPQSVSSKKSDSDARLSISELTKKKAKAVDASDKKEEPVIQSRPWSNFIGNDKVPEVPAPKPPPVVAPPAAKVIKVDPPKKTVEPPAKKGPIRMQLPPSDDDEDDDDDGVDAKANASMSIADAMKKTKASAGGNQAEQSKKWGVDMTRFLDK